MKTDRRVGGEIDVDLQGCDHTYSMRLRRRETLHLNELQHRPKIFSAEVNETNGVEPVRIDCELVEQSRRGASPLLSRKATKP